MPACMREDLRKLGLVLADNFSMSVKYNKTCRTANLAYQLANTEYSNSRRPAIKTSDKFSSSQFPSLKAISSVSTLLAKR